MDKNQIQKLFKPFTTASDDHHKIYGGTGIGLWISKIIVELMGGQITCKSVPGEGTTFSFVMPVDYFAYEQAEAMMSNQDSKCQNGSAINLANRIKRLTDMAKVLEGQKIIFILVNSEDIVLLRERLKVIKDVDIHEYKNID